MVNFEHGKYDVTLKEWMKFLCSKKEHYPISDEFVRKYQQAPTNKNGYIFYAWEVGHLIQKRMAEPNQKWHFFDAYILKLLEANKVNLDDSAKRIYGRIKCPELLLWIAEASGIESEIVEDASKEAKNIIDRNNKNARNSAGDTIRKKIPWERIEENCTTYLFEGRGPYEYPIGESKTNDYRIFESR